MVWNDYHMWDDFRILRIKKISNCPLPYHHQELNKQYLHDSGQSGGFQDIVVMVAGWNCGGSFPYPIAIRCINLFAGINRGSLLKSTHGLYVAKQFCLNGPQRFKFNDQILTVKKNLEGNLHQLIVGGGGSKSIQLMVYRQWLMKRYRQNNNFPHIVDFALPLWMTSVKRPRKGYDALIVRNFGGLKLKRYS